MTSGAQSLSALFGSPEASPEGDISICELKVCCPPVMRSDTAQDQGEHALMSVQDTTGTTN